MATFELCFDDLTEHAKEVILQYAGIKDPSEKNWDCFPITTIEFEDIEDESEGGDEF